MKKTLTIGLSALALTMAGTAYANHHGEQGMKADANGDGIVTRSEAQAGASARFAKMDANNDGALTDADREARREARRTSMFETLDADNNGTISKTEFMSFEHEGKGGKHHRMGKRGDRGGKMMQMADTNNDGTISEAEFTAASLTRFDKADANSDGQVTSEERKAMRDEMRGKWREMKRDRTAS